MGKLCGGELLQLLIFHKTAYFFLLKSPRHNAPQSEATAIADDVFPVFGLEVFYEILFNENKIVSVFSSLSIKPLPIVYPSGVTISFIINVGISVVVCIVST